MSLSSSCHNGWGRGEKKGLEREETHPDTKKCRKGKGEGREERGRREGSISTVIFLKGPDYRKGPASSPSTSLFPVLKNHPGGSPLSFPHD